jgi:hypothetical protein
MNRPYQQYTRCLSIVLIISFVAQGVLGAFPPVPAQAAPSIQTEIPAPHLTLADQARRLENALQQLIRATDDAAYRAAVADVEINWNGLLRAEQQLHAQLTEEMQRLSVLPATAASTRQAEMLDALNVHFDQLATLYQSLADAIANDRAAVEGRAVQLHEALLASHEPTAPAPSLDILPIQTVPKVEPQVVVLEQAVAADSQEHPLNSALPAQGEPPTEEDLAPTEDAAITPEIQTLADQLGNDPVAIYAYVRNTIAFEPYYGSRKGSLLTLWERSGSDIDIASLLVALLRASAIPARYVRGTVLVDTARAQNWVGNAPDLTTAGTILATGGVTVSVTTGGELLKDHVWVAAYVNDAWVPLDPSFKQFTYVPPTDFVALTGFDAVEWIDQVRAVTLVTDTLQAVAMMPMLLPPEDQTDDEAALEFAEVKTADAISRTLGYVNANPTLTNVDLLGGAYIITQTLTSLPESFPLTVLPDTPLTEYSALPEAFRAYLTVEILDSSDDMELSHRASLPSLANQRITIAYEAATAEDQSVIDDNGGTLLTTPPVIDLVPVLRIGGTEVARGSPARMGQFQTRRLTFTFPNGQTDSVENRVSVGDTVAIGLGYGRTSADAIAASHQRLDEARRVPPTALPEAPQPEQPHQGQQFYFPLITQEGTTQANAAVQSHSSAEQDESHAALAPLQGNVNDLLDPNDPANMSEPVIGEMLYQALQAYFNQLDTVTEVVARERQIRWWRGLTVGVASQELVFLRLFGIPLDTLGGGMLFDIQRDATASISLRNQPADEQAFRRVKGHFASALEHEVFEELGYSALSTIRLHSLALEQGIPVYRIDATNRATVFPLLDLNLFVERQISNQLDRGRIVTVSAQEIKAGDWSGVGWIVQEPETGRSAYLISGGLSGNLFTHSGGSLTETLDSIAAYAMLAINMGLDVWGLVAGISLLLVPEPTLMTKVAGLALIASSLAALGFDVADLMDLVSGDISASQYIGEQVSGLIVQAILKRVGIAAASRIIDRIGPGAMDTLLRQVDDLTGGAITRLRASCSMVAEAAGVATVAPVAWIAISPPQPAQICPGLTPEEIVQYSHRVGSAENWETLADLSDLVSSRTLPGPPMSGGEAVRTLLNNTVMIKNPAQLQRVARAILDAPRQINGADIPGYDAVLRGSVGSIGGAWQFHVAKQYQDAGEVILEYEKKFGNVTFPSFQGLDANNRPIFDATRPATQQFDADIFLAGDIASETKWQTPAITEPRFWNQISKATVALEQGLIREYRIEAPKHMIVAQAYKDYINSLPESISSRIKVINNRDNPFTE